MTNHKDRACELFKKGCNCSQAVFAAFSDVTGISEETALRLSSSFGGGMGRLREVCGTFSAVLMVAGLLYGYSDISDPSKKAEHYALVQRLACEFKAKNGTIICRELLKSLNVSSSPVPTPRTEEFYKVRPCIRFVADAADILDRLIAEKGEG